MAATYLYWISTALLSLLYVTSATLYMTRWSWVRQAMADLSFPAPYLQPLLIVVKLLGVAAVLSRVSVPLSDLAYAGMLYHLLLAGLAHLGVHKSKQALPAAIGLVLLAVSFTTQNAARAVPSPYAQIAER
jgi:hypothetical protein